MLCVDRLFFPQPIPLHHSLFCPFCQMEPSSVAFRAGMRYNEADDFVTKGRKKRCPPETMEKAPPSAGPPDARCAGTRCRWRAFSLRTPLCGRWRLRRFICGSRRLSSARSLARGGRLSPRRCICSLFFRCAHGRASGCGFIPRPACRVRKGRPIGSIFRASCCALPAA